ncbi:MAG TPA: fatty acid desaturase [Polyangiaceae bacterium]|nr:fatty acid desaturase [Polyangiaceae bacterium]
MESALTLDPSGEATRSDVPPPPSAPRDGKALIEATKPFAVEDTAESWRHLVVVIAVLSAAIAGAAAAPYWPLRLFASIVAGLTIVRLFIVYHDFMHGAVLKDSKLARALLSLYGMLVLAPPRVWKETHNYHHAHTAQIVGSHIGSYPVVTVDMWQKLGARDRLKYRIVRHPLTVLLGYVPIFMIGMCVNSLRKSVTKYWDSAVALVLNWSITFVLIWQLGFATAFFAYLLPLMVACASGAYLFYAQHNFPSMQLQPRHEWTYTKAALESSSYMPMNPVMQWFFGNIGFHHVHHLNPLIPFYRLPIAMSEIPELQTPGETSLAPSEIARCFSLKLWDPKQKKMVGYP